MTVTLDEQKNPQIETHYGDTLDESADSPKVTVSQIRPAPGTLVVRQKERKTKTKGGLHLPDIAQEESSQGEIVAVHDETGFYKKGDWVIFRRGGVRLPLPDEPNLIVLQHRGGIDDEILVKIVAHGTVVPIE